MKIQGKLNQIDNIWLSDDKKDILVYIEELSLNIENKDIEIKVGDNKVKATMFEFMQAFKDMLDEGVFSLDQIDSEVWSTENELEKAKEQRDSAFETLAEIRGGF